MGKRSLKFGEMLTEAVYLIRSIEHKNISIVQDEFGYALGRQGGSLIERWRKGYLPPRINDIEQLTRLIITRSQGRFDRAWTESFLHHAGHLYPKQLCDEIFDSHQDVPPAQRPINPLSIQKSSLIKTQLETPHLQLAPFVVGPPIFHPRLFFWSIERT